MRIVMMGTGPFAIPTFRWLLESGHTIPALVTRPIPPARGRQKGPANPMRELAEQCAAHVPILAPDNINDPLAQSALRDLRADLFVVCDYGQILSRDTLGLAQWGGINLHASLLPRYRGAAPIHWAIYWGETQTGVTVIAMSPRLDAGDCLHQISVPIGPRETSPELEERLSQLGANAVQAVVTHLATHDSFPPGVEQEDAIATRAPRLKKSDGMVDWHRSAEAIERQVRALRPWPGVFTDWLRPDQAPLRLLLDQVERCPAATGPSPSTVASQPTPPGTVVGLPTGSAQAPILVQTGEGILALQTLHPAGKHPMSAAEFQRGYRLTLGSQFGPAEMP